MNETDKTTQAKDVVRIVMFGQKDSWSKGLICNTLIGEEKLDSKDITDTITSKYETLSFIHDNREYLFLDTADLLNLKLNEENLDKEIRYIMDLAYPGPHVFIILVDLSRFKREESKTIELMSDIFGENIFDNCMILFTGLNDFKSESVELKDYIEQSNDYIKELVRLCNGFYIGINNKEIDVTTKEKLRNNVLQMINIIAKNGKGHYSIEKYDNAKRKYREKLCQLELKREKEMKKIDELKHEYDEKINKITRDLDPAVQVLKKKWYEKLSDDVKKFFRLKK